MKRTGFLLLGLFLPFISAAQTPTLVQHVSCPNSQAIVSGIGGPVTPNTDYYCPLPELSQSGNTLMLGLIVDNSANPGVFTVSDDNSNAWTQAATATDSTGHVIRLYYAPNVAKNTHILHVHSTAVTNGYWAMSASEYYNVGAFDKASCTTASSSSTTISSGNLIPTANGELLWQWAADANSGEISSFTVGSQSGVTWQFLGADIHDGNAVQAGVQGTAATINPTFTAGTSEPWDSCTMAFASATAGNPPTSPFRIVHMQHAQQSQNDASTYTNQFPSSGNLLVMSFQSGGNSATGVTSPPSTTWMQAGALGNGGVVQYFYIPNATTSNSLKYTVTETGTMTGTVLMMYDIIGAAASPFDKESGTIWNTQQTITNNLTTCSTSLNGGSGSCVFAPSAANELVMGGMGQGWCTTTALTSPSGGLYDTAVFTSNSVNGPQSVDQNNGWFHYYDPNTSNLTVSWAETCGTTQEASWVSRLVAFKAAGSVTTPPAPPTSLRAVVN